MMKKKFLAIALTILLSLFMANTCLASSVQIHPPWGEDGNELYVRSFQKDTLLICKQQTSTAINTCLTNLGANGELYLPAGTYALTAAIAVNADNVTITGAGPGTVLRIDSAAIYGINIGDGANTFTLRNLRIDGNKASIAGGLACIYKNDTSNDDKRLLVENVIIENYTSYGFYLGTSGKSTAQVLINNCSFSDDAAGSTCAIYAYHPGQQKITGCQFKYLEGDGIQCQDNSFGSLSVSICDFSQIKGYGIFHNGTGVWDYPRLMISDNTFGDIIYTAYSFTAAIYIKNDRNVVITGNSFHSSATNLINLENVTNSEVTNNNFVNTDASNADIYLNGCLGNCVSGNTFIGRSTVSWSDYHIKGVDSDLNKVFFNAFSGTVDEYVVYFDADSSLNEIFANTYPYTGDEIYGAKVDTIKWCGVHTKRNRFEQETEGTDFYTTGGIKLSTIAGAMHTFVYDTSGDSDSGAWRNDDRARSSSWYWETLHQSDRGRQRDFPKNVILIASATNLYLYDAKVNAMWLQFNEGAGNALPTGTWSCTYGIEGKVFVGDSGGTGLYCFDFIRDIMTRYDTTDAREANKRIGVRNDGEVTYMAMNRASEAIIDGVINDIHARYIDDKLYVAIATDTGVSIIHWPDRITYDYSDNAGDDYNAVWLDAEGNLYAVNEAQAQIERWNNVIDDTADEIAGTPDQTWDETTTPALWTAAPTIATAAPDQLYVIDGGSFVDGASDALYFAHGSGTTRIDLKEGDQTNGAAKYYTKDYISELMTGDVKAMWPLYEANSTSPANGTTIDDVSIGGNDLTVTAGTGGITQRGAVRCNGLEFDGTDDFLSRPDDSDFDFVAADNWYVSIWFKHDTISAAEYLVVKRESGVNAGYALFMDSDGDITFEIDDDAAWGPDDGIGGALSRNYDDDQWHHILAGKIGTTGIYLYVDGVLQASDETIAATGTLENDDPFFLGVDDDGASNKWDGYLDEIMIVKEAPSVTIAQRLYETGLLALNQHDSDRVTGITGSGRFQKLQGSVNTCTSVTGDDDGKLVCIGSNDAAANTGALTIIGIGADSVLDLYSTTNTSKEDNGSRSYDPAQFDINDILSASVSGKFIPNFNTSVNRSPTGGILSVVGTTDTSTKLWMESQQARILDALASEKISTSGAGKVTYEIKTADYSITTSDFGKCIVLNSANDRTFSLPSMGPNENGAQINFLNVGAGRLTLDAADSDYIDDSGAGNGIYTDDQDAALTLQYFDASTKWMIVHGFKTWTTY